MSDQGVPLILSNGVCVWCVGGGWWVECVGGVGGWWVECVGEWGGADN